MTEIYSGPTYTIDSDGNCARVTITHIADGASVFLQDEEALSFIDRVEHTYDTSDVDTPLHDLCAEHDELIVGGRGMGAFPRYAITFDVSVVDLTRLYQAALARGIEDPTIADFIGTAEEPNIEACLQMLYDPGVSLPGTEIKNCAVDHVS